jgi:hypothetical protein
MRNYCWLTLGSLLIEYMELLEFRSRGSFDGEFYSERGSNFFEDCLSLVYLGDPFMANFEAGGV